MWTLLETTKLFFQNTCIFSIHSCVIRVRLLPVPRQGQHFKDLLFAPSDSSSFSTLLPEAEVNGLHKLSGSQALWSLVWFHQW